jgi:hypothetical protein
MRCAVADSPALCRSCHTLTFFASFTFHPHTITHTIAQSELEQELADLESELADESLADLQQPVRVPARGQAIAASAASSMVDLSGMWHIQVRM